jgi:putative DNA primase/helicase
MTARDDAKKLADKYILKDGTDPSAPGAAKILQLQREQEPPSVEEVEDEIRQLATLSKLDYERERQRVHVRTGYRLSTIDSLVEEERKKIPPPDPSDDRPPSVEPVIGTELVNDLITNLTKHISLEPDYAATAAFWVIHTYLLDYIRITPRLAITAPEKRCGKTTFIDWLGTVVQRPKRSDNISAAAVYRVVEQLRPTLLIDEADTYLGNNQELRGILNSGHRSDGRVDRATKGGDLVSFSTYSACAIALIGALPETLHDRSIRIRLRRRRPDEKIASLRGDRTDDTLARRCARWTLDCRDACASADPAIPPELFNRVEDNWRPLLAIADAIGGEWPRRLREIAVNIAQLEAGEDPSVGTRLLQDIREILGDREWISSSALIGNLHVREWAIPSGKQLANLLKPYGIAPTQERRGGRPERGYLATDFADAFTRYLSVPDVPLVPAKPDVKEEKPSALDNAAGTNGTNGTPKRAYRRF